MANLVATVSKPSSVKGEWKVGNRSFKVRDLTIDTGNYSSGGFTVTAASFGLKKFDFVLVGSVATTGTSGATASPVGIQYASDGTSITVFLYEGAASGAALGQKTNAEAVESNFTVRLLAAG